MKPTSPPAAGGFRQIEPFPDFDQRFGQHEPQRIVGDLLNAEIGEKQARSIKYQLIIAKLPLAKDVDVFQCEGTPINQTLVNDLAGGGFIAQQRNAVLVGGTGTGMPRTPESLRLLQRKFPFSGDSVRRPKHKTTEWHPHQFDGSGILF